MGSRRDVSPAFNFHGCCQYYYFLGVTMTMIWLLDSSIVFAMDYRGLSKEQLITQQCDGLPTSRRLLTATPSKQKKEYRFSPLARVKLTAPSGGGYTSEGSACEVWDFRLLPMETWVVVVLTGMRFQLNDSFFVVTVTEPESGVTRIERYGIDVHGTGFSSKGPLTLLWVRRNRLSPRKGNESILEPEVVDRKLAFSYFTNDVAKIEENKDELVLISAIVLCIIALGATVMSITRAVTCQRTCFLPCCPRQHHHDTTRTNSNIYNCIATPRDDMFTNNDTINTTTRRSIQRSETFLLMEMEVTRQMSPSNDHNNNYNNNNDNNNGDDSSDASESMLPPRYDQIIGHVVQFRNERQSNIRNGPSIIPEVDEEADDDRDDEGVDDDDETGTAVNEINDAISNRRPSPVVDLGNNNNQLDDVTLQGSSSANNANSEMAQGTSGIPSPSGSTATASSLSSAQSSPLSSTTAAPPSALSSSSSSLSASSGAIQTTSTLQLSSTVVLTPPTFRPPLQLPHRRQATNSSCGSRHLNPLEPELTTLFENETVGVAGMKDEAPPPSYYDESPPPSYDSLFHHTH